MRYNILIYIAFLLLATKAIFAQNQSINIFGYIHDIDDNPIDAVNITIDKTTHGAVSDQNGLFKLNIHNKPGKLIISHISYKKHEVKITKKMLDEVAETKIITLDILLESNVLTLSPVLISGDKAQLAYHNEKAWILDYELSDGVFIFLLLEKGKKILRIVDDADESLFLEKEIPKQCKKLYKDCFGSLHLMTKDSVYQVFFSDSAIITPYSASIKFFNEFIKPCQVVTNHKIITERVSYFNQSVGYIMIDKETKEKKY